MNMDRMKQIIEDSGYFDVYDIPYKEEYWEKYGKSGIDTYIRDNRSYVYVTVNGGTFKVRRICEEFGKVLFIYDGNQISFRPEAIKTIIFK